MRGHSKSGQLHLCEVRPCLKKTKRRNVGSMCWHETLSSSPRKPKQKIRVETVRELWWNQRRHREHTCNRPALEAVLMDARPGRGSLGRAAPQELSQRQQVVEVRPCRKEAEERTPSVPTHIGIRVSVGNPWCLSCSPTGLSASRIPPRLWMWRCAAVACQAQTSREHWFAS